MKLILPYLFYPSMEKHEYISLLIIPILSLFLYFFLKPKNKPPKNGFPAYPILGTLPQFLANRRRYLDWATDILALHPTHTAIFYRPGRVHGIMTADPANVEHILKTNFSNYPKGPRFISYLHDFLGSGIFNSDDHLWRLQRKTASFEFNKRSLKSFVLDSIRSEVETRLVPLLKKASKSGRVVDLQDMLERFAFDNVCKLAFDVDPGCLAGDGSGESKFMRAFEEATTISSGRFMYALPGLWKVKKLFNVGSERRLRESIKTVHDYADNIIRLRLQDKSVRQHEDLLSRFIASTYHQDINDQSVTLENIQTEEGNSLLARGSINFLRDVVISFILAGRDTTSSGLSWFFWLLSLNPNVLQKIRSEVSRVRNGSGKRVGQTYGFEELKEMNYLHGAISETLRLYPPVPIDTRVCLQDDILPDGTEVKKDWFAAYHPYAMGRMESIWGKDCLEFRPERWLDENGLYKADSPFRYPVFHAGPRICLGMELAYMQMKSIVACLVEQLDVDVLGKETRPQYMLSLTLRMKDGLPVKVKEVDCVN